MQLGMIGLGRMGANMVRRLEKNGHSCVVYDRTPATVNQLALEGATGSTNLPQIASFLAHNVLVHDGVLLAGMSLLLVGFVCNLLVRPAGSDALPTSRMTPH